MKKLVVVCMLLVLTITGCSAKNISKADNNATKLSESVDETAYLLKSIDNVPEGWKTADKQCFYYDINTNIIYVGNTNIGIMSSINRHDVFVYKLESAEYRCYTYDTETGEFVGVK